MHCGGADTLQIKGQATLHATRDRVWLTLLSAEALQHCLPGCQEFQEIGPYEWEATMSIGMAGIKGTYAGKVKITDQVLETSYRLAVEGAGGGNRIKGTGIVTLRDGADGTTVITYDGEGQIVGILAAVGQRLFQPAARVMAEQFFKCMGTQVPSSA